MCKGLSYLPASCLEKAKGMKVKLTHLAEKQEWTHKHRTHEKIFQDLESLLNSKMGQQLFRWFLRSEFSEENLEFWLACEEYRTAPEAQLNLKALSIYGQFINSESPQEVNLDSATKEGLTTMMEEPTTGTFHKAQQRIYTLMAKDSFPRFLRSSYYQEALKAL